MISFHRAELGDVLFHDPHLLVDIVKLGGIGSDDVRSVGFGPADQHRVGVFERGAFVRGRDTVFDLHKEHIPHDAQSFGCQSQSEHWVGQVRVPWVLVVLHGVLHIVLHDFVAHSLTCPVP